MALAISPPKSGALTNYSDLIEEVRDQLDDDAYPEIRIERALRKAEAYFRRELPIGRAPVSVTVSVTDPSNDIAPTEVIEVGDPDTESRYEYLTPLTAASPTNWLLERHPDLYVAGALYYCHVRDGAVNQAAEALNAVGALLESARLYEIRSQWGRGPLIPTGIMQVRGARA